MCAGLGVTEVPGGTKVYACPRLDNDGFPRTTEEQRAAHVLLYYSARLRRHICRKAGVRSPERLCILSGDEPPRRPASGRPVVEVGAGYVLARAELDRV